MGAVLAIDQGTSGTKAVVVDDGGQVLALAEIGLRPRYLVGGGVEQDPQQLLDSVLAAGREAVDRAGVLVDAVALANQGETVLAWDPDTGSVLSPALVWQDRRAEEVCARRRDSAARVAELTGLVLDPYFSAPKMRWLRDHVTTEGVVTTTDCWLVHRLCGAFVTDRSTASRSLLLDLDERAWSAELLDVFGLGAERLPDVVASDVVVGSTSEFGGSVDVTGLVVDQQAALLAQSCLEPGTAKCTYGTGAFLLVQLGLDPTRSTSGLTTSVAWELGGRASYCADGQAYTAASALRWASDLGLAASAEELDAVAATVTTSEGALCVPAFAGLAAPWWEPSATASFTSMTLSTSRAHLLRALLEGVAAQVACLTALAGEDLGVPLTRLRVDGGLTRSAVLMQAQADLSQVPVEVYPSAHATALGAAVCARLALDPSLGVADAVVAWAPEHTFEPRWSAGQAAEHLDRWREAAADAVLTRTPAHHDLPAPKSRG